MIDYMGLASIGVFYILILLVGLWAARRSKKNQTAETTDTEDVFLAGRNINLLVGIFTMTATWVGGGYINGTAELIYKPSQGIAWCQAPLGYTMSLIVGGMFFASKMRNEGYVTMLDPFQIRFGEWMTALLFIPALLGEIFWSAAILSALGSSLSVVTSIRMEYTIVFSTCIALFYTLIGGLYSVAYTDVVQLFCIFIGLWLCVPFAMLNEHVSFNTDSSRYLGSIDRLDIGTYADGLIMLTLGGIPWQVYFQRVLSSKTAGRAQILSYVASLGCFVMAIPAGLIGVAAGQANWTAAGYDGIDKDGLIKSENQRLVLPLVLQYLCPKWVSVVGLGAVSAAVMSSADSSVFSAASMFARNVIKPICWPKATEQQVIWTMRFLIFVVGAMACLLGIYIKSIYDLWVLSSDLVYVILFPQLVSVLFIPFSNTYGSLIGYVIGLGFRILTGEAALGIPAIIQFPGFIQTENTYYQRWPTKTLSMITSLLVNVIVSYITHRLFVGEVLSLDYDVFGCYREPADDGSEDKGIDEKKTVDANELSLLKQEISVDD